MGGLMASLLFVQPEESRISRLWQRDDVLAGNGLRIVRHVLPGDGRDQVRRGLQREPGIGVGGPTDVEAAAAQADGEPWRAMLDDERGDGGTVVFAPDFIARQRGQAETGENTGGAGSGQHIESVAGGGRVAAEQV